MSLRACSPPDVLTTTTTKKKTNVKGNEKWKWKYVYVIEPENRNQKVNTVFYVEQNKKENQIIFEFYTCFALFDSSAKMDYLMQHAFSG